MRILNAPKVTLLGLTLALVACAPATRPAAAPLMMYQAQATEVEQAIRDVSASFANLPGFQSLVLAPKQSVDGKIFLTSPIRVTSKGELISAVNVLDERELIFIVTGKNGVTTVDYRTTGQVQQQLRTVLNALDQRFTRLNQP